MKDINYLIEETVKRTGQPEELVEKIIRNMFHDVQQFTSKKQGYCIMIPHVGSFVFRANAIPNYIARQKSTAGHWVARLFIGKEKNLQITINAARNNIFKCFYNLKAVSLIKQEFLNDHSRYKPKTTKYLNEDPHSDPERVVDYVNLLSSEIGAEELGKISEEGVQQMSI